MIADTAITETSLTGTPMAAAMITEAAQKLHKPLTLFTPCPPASDRESWEKLSEDLKARLIKNGEQYLHYAVAEYLLRSELNEVSPFLSVMIGHELETRIFTPYLEEHFWWMGDGKSHMNNWTVWCTQNVLLSAFTRPLPSETQTRILCRAARSIDYFLDEYGEDGCCDEGAQYYRHAGLCLFGCLEILNGITDHAFSFAWKQEKIRNIASYILNVHVDICLVSGPITGL